ncbi:Uncharacterised protein [Legionella busanensis]|uniref:Uncharacterized protein n=1 Tax=Legionella busanensis TaxID=190655 RepID=A0A378JXH9_9GAMM|nr:Uncharacterised protein [Legionella busanensis]
MIENFTSSVKPSESTSYGLFNSRLIGLGNLGENVDLMVF